MPYFDTQPIIPKTNYSVHGSTREAKINIDTDINKNNLLDDANFGGSTATATLIIDHKERKQPTHKVMDKLKELGKYDSVVDKLGELESYEGAEDVLNKLENKNPKNLIIIN